MVDCRKTCGCALCRRIAGNKKRARRGEKKKMKYRNFARRCRQGSRFVGRSDVRPICRRRQRHTRNQWVGKQRLQHKSVELFNTKKKPTRGHGHKQTQKKSPSTTHTTHTKPSTNHRVLVSAGYRPANDPHLTSQLGDNKQVGSTRLAT